MPRPLAWGLFIVLVLIAAAVPAAAQSVSDSPTLSVSDRLDDRRYVATGDRAYEVGTEDGRFPAMGFHTRGEMGGVWSPPIKLLDGIWFGIGNKWIGPATRFTSGYGHVKMDLPAGKGLTVTRTDFVPDGHRAALFGLTFTAGKTQQRFALRMDAHSELMGAYPWGETNPSQKTFNLEDTASFDGQRLVFQEQGTPTVTNAQSHDWAAVVGSSLTPTGGETGSGYRGPQDPPDICAAPPAPNNEPADGCDDTELGKGKGGQLRYQMNVPANTTQTVWFAVAGSESGVADARAEQAAVLQDPESLLEEKVSARLGLQSQTELDLPGDRPLQESIDWSKQNLADSVQSADDLEIRETNAGKNYPAPEGTVDHVRFLGAGFPDYPWLFATDGEYTAFASVAVGQFGPIKDHLRALKEVSLVDNDTSHDGVRNDFSGKVVHEVVTDGSVYFGSNADAGNTDETAKFPSAVALIWRWTGDDGFRDEMYGFSKSNMEYIFRELDQDGDLWPEGLGNVERAGMGEEKLDNAVYTIRGLYDLADMARSKGDTATESWALERARAMEEKFEAAWWFGRQGATQYADSLRNPGNEQVFQRHWIGATPMEVELAGTAGEPRPGLASNSHGLAALSERELACYTDDFGMYHTGTGPTSAEAGNPGPSCDSHVSEVPSERTIFTLNTAIMAVGEGNYGRLGGSQQQHYTDANADLQLIPDEQPGAMPEIAPSPDYGRSIDRPFNERAMVLQAWGAYGTIWPVVHQQLGVRPDMGRGELEVVPQVPEGQPGLSGDNIRLGDGSVNVSAERERNTYRTTVEPHVTLQRLTIGYAVPSGKRVESVTLDDSSVSYSLRETNRGKEVLVDAPTTGVHTLEVAVR